jgi:hypothetical protein
MEPTTSSTAAALITELNELSLDNINGSQEKALKLCRKLTVCLEDPVSRAINLAFKV